jgi:HAD superfamily hydrolase (TIGR01490 family)
MKLALFDLDNTLLGGDSDYAWSQFLIEEGILDREKFEQTSGWFLKEYERGSIVMEDWLAFQLKPLAGRPRAQLEDWHRRFMEKKIRPIILAKAAPLIASHGDALQALVTATNRFITEPIARELGIPHLIASEIELGEDGTFTGRPSGQPSFGKGKVARVGDWLAAQDLKLGDFRESWFYSDSHNDIPLLEAVSHPVAVDPDAKLRKHAEGKGWRVMSLRT